MRYVLNNPTSWAFDMSYILYGAAVHHGGRLRLVARRPRARRRVLPVAADRACRRASSWCSTSSSSIPASPRWSSPATAMRTTRSAIREVSVNSPVGVPIWQLKVLIPLAGTMLFIQGIAQVIRCVLCIRDGYWPRQLHDVEELESVLQHEHEKHAAREGRP